MHAPNILPMIDPECETGNACMDGPADIYLGVMYLASLALT